MIILLGIVLVVAVIVTSLASQQAVGSAMTLVDRVGMSPALVGLVVLSIGTDLPEIANSIVATSSGHGDVNVGDSIGSVIAQITLVLGLLSLAGRELTSNRAFVAAVGTATFFAVLLVWALLLDNELSHVDGIIMLVGWAGGTAALSRGRGPAAPVPMAQVRQGSGDLVRTVLWLAVVGAGALVVVESFLAITERLGLPEFIASFVALSIGTSLPELAVDLTAIRRGATSMAIGDIFGSSFVDATLSIGIGPALFSSAISPEVIPAVAAAAVGVLAVTLLTAGTNLRGWGLALPLFGVYGGVYAVALV